MVLSWIEIKNNALRFSKEWKDEVSEDAEAKSFWDAFFKVFGVDRRRLAQFEKAVSRIGRGSGFIDLFWPGVLIVEHKSRGKNLNKAYGQAVDYFEGLKDHELPRYILVSDFAHFRLYDLDEKTEHEFPLQDLYIHIKEFGFMLGQQKRTYKEQDPINIDAAHKMGDLHDKLKEVGYDGHNLEVYLVRLLFCLFADDTGIFDKSIFQDYIVQNTKEDGSDLGSRLAILFQILDTSKEKRPKNLDETLSQFPYVNGKLFREQLPISTFDAAMRQTLLDCSALDWGLISPAIFGSLFQSVMNLVERHSIGAHYTSEKNILKVIKNLFLDELWEEFRTVQTDKRKLIVFHGKIANLRFLDPACGCGNFLVITYRELRLLEIEVIKAIQKGQYVTSVNDLVLVDVDQFYGIEYEEFPAQISQVALWLIDHQMNMRISEEFGDYYVRLPLIKAATIVHGNALRTSWQSLLPELDEPEKRLKYDYILGNPPFLGSRVMTREQKDDINHVFKNHKGAGELDYVAAWYKLASDYLTVNPECEVGLVSTNSVAQGTQVGIIWPEILKKGITINFAHQTFKWSNEAKGLAAVHVVIIGFGIKQKQTKKIFTYSDVKGEPLVFEAKNINPYLLDYSNIIISSRQKPLSNVVGMNFGNMPAEGGEFLFTEEEKNDFLSDEPKASKYMKLLISAHEFLNGKNRYCLWLKDANPTDIRTLPRILERVENVRRIRLSSSRPFLADTPTLFAQITQPQGKPFILIPRHSSANRTYVPFGYFNGDEIVHDSCMLVADDSLYTFGVLSSIMHMVWMRYVCGRLKSDYRYSKDIVYNNFPWPLLPEEKQVKAVATAAQNVLDVRASFSVSNLADLYDPLTMPQTLIKAHHALDRAVDLCYRPKSFPNDLKRMEHLFTLYEELTTPLIGAGLKTNGAGTKKAKKTK